jgi:hypothetical protein
LVCKIYSRALAVQTCARCAAPPTNRHNFRKLTARAVSVCAGRPTARRPTGRFEPNLCARGERAGIQPGDYDSSRFRTQKHPRNGDAAAAALLQRLPLSRSRQRHATPHVFCVCLRRCRDIYGVAAIGSVAVNKIIANIQSAPGTMRCLARVNKPRSCVDARV